MGKLEGRGSLRREQLSEPGHEIVEIGNVGQHIVGDDQVGGPALGLEFRRGLAAEESDDRLQSVVPLRRLGAVRRRVDAERRDAAPQEILQQVAVVARHFDHARRWPQFEPIDCHRREALGMFQPGR